MAGTPSSNARTAAVASVRLHDQGMANEQESFPRFALRGFVLLITVGAAVASVQAAWNHQWFMAMLGLGWSLLGVAILTGPGTVVSAMARRTDR